MPPKETPVQENATFFGEKETKTSASASRDDIHVHIKIRSFDEV